MDKPYKLRLIVTLILLPVCGVAFGSPASNETISFQAEEGSLNGPVVACEEEHIVFGNSCEAPVNDTNPGTNGSPPPTGYELVWSDEFDGTALDATKWTHQDGTWNGSAVQNCYVAENSTVSGGLLSIIAKYEPGYSCFNATRNFTSGFIQTKDTFSWTYGYFEARVKVPESDSTWPAFWMSPQTDTYGSWPLSGEIDIFEIRGHDTTVSHSNAHWGNSETDKQHRQGDYTVGDATQWHVYAVEWEEGSLKFYIDGIHYHTINNFNEPNATTDPGPFNIPFYLRLNLAVGGTYLESPHNDANYNLNQLPATMEVDYVRVYQK